MTGPKIAQTIYQRAHELRPRCHNTIHVLTGGPYFPSRTMIQIVNTYPSTDGPRQASDVAAFYLEPDQLRELVAALTQRLEEIKDT